MAQLTMSGITSKRAANWRILFICAFLIFAVFVIYWQVRQYNFVNVDDPLYVSGSPHIRDGLTWKGIKWALTADLFFDSKHADYWQPMTMISRMLDMELYGLNAGGHHITNVLFHMINVILCFLIFYRMTGDLWPSAFVASIFAVHPVNVEAVAWVTARKDVLSTFFALLAIWFYIGYIKKPSAARFLPVTFSFFLGLLAKPVILTLPCVLLLLDYWPLKRIHYHGWKKKEALVLIREKWPLFLLAFGIVLIPFIGQPTALSYDSPLIVLSNAVGTYVSYIYKLVSPFSLAIHSPAKGLFYPIWQVVGSALILIGLVYFIFNKRANWPFLFTGLFWFLGALIPCIGLNPPAERFLYFPSIGLWIIATWGISKIIAKHNYHKIILSLIAGSILSSYGVLAWAQTGHWENSVKLFEHAIQVAPSNNYLAYLDLGNAYEERNQYKKAIDAYLKMIEFGYGGAEAYNNLGVSYSDLEDYKKAVEYYKKSLAFDSENAAAYLNLGSAYAKQKKFDEAVKNFKTAIAKRPNFAHAYLNLGVLHVRLKEYDEAIKNFETAIQKNPYYADAYYASGIVYGVVGKFPKVSEKINQLKGKLDRDDLAVKLEKHLRDNDFLTKVELLSPEEKELRKEMKRITAIVNRANFINRTRKITEMINAAKKTARLRNIPKVYNK